MKQLLTHKREGRNNTGIFAVFPFPKSVGILGRKGNIAYRHIPRSPAGSRGAMGNIWIMSFILTHGGFCGTVGINHGETE